MMNTVNPCYKSQNMHQLLLSVFWPIATTTNTKEYSTSDCCVHEQAMSSLQLYWTDPIRILPNIRSSCLLFGNNKPSDLDCIGECCCCRVVCP